MLKWMLLKENRLEEKKNEKKERNKQCDKLICIYAHLKATNINFFTCFKQYSSHSNDKNLQHVFAVLPPTCKFNNLVN